MRPHRKLATWTGAVLGTVCALLLASAHGSDSRRFTAEFHQSYSLPANGRVELSNINGAVHITGWDRNEIKVDAIKYAGSLERLDEAQIEVEPRANSISIRTRYKDSDLTFNDDSRDNPAGVEYTLTVPRTAQLDEIKLVNGNLDLQGLSGEVRASCVNGRLNARDLAGRVKLTTVNGRLNAQFSRLSNAPVELSSVNGEVELTLPSGLNAEVQASTVMGNIENDFGMNVRKHRYVGSDLHAELGSGGNRIELHNVNGRIMIRHSNDNASVGPVKDLHTDSDSDRDDDDDDNQI